MGRKARSPKRGAPLGNTVGRADGPPPLCCLMTPRAVGVSLRRNPRGLVEEPGSRHPRSVGRGTCPQSRARLLRVGKPRLLILPIVRF